jgi:hypothetical protein
MNFTNSTKSITPISIPYILYSSFKEMACLFSIITNLINIFVFVNPKLNNPIYSYMLTISTTNFIYMSLCLLGVIISTCTSCQLNTTYFGSFYTIASTFYFTSSLALFRILVEVCVSLSTYCTLKNFTWMNRVSYKLILPCLFIFSLIAYGQQPFSYEIVNTNINDMTFTTKTSWFGNTVMGKMWAIIQASTRIFLIVCVLSLLNSLNLYEFYKRFKGRKQSKYLIILK